MGSYKHLINPTVGLLSEIHLWKITLKIWATKNTPLKLYRYCRTERNTPFGCGREFTVTLNLA